MMTKPSSSMVSKRLNSLKRRTPLSTPDSAEMLASTTTITMTAIKKLAVSVFQPVRVCIPAAICRAP